ncbi:MAG: CerR family C-terminal domain-containing protein [Deltaproteobacteria bacterium]|nr:CerR family C-terminal domain-containing protein [Deltaproteobacteria bacterium]
MAKTQITKPKSTAKDRLLEAAVDVFGKYGFEAATTRMIAKKAGVNIASIPYYFNGKEGLYQAAITYIVEKIEAKFGTALQNMAELATGENPNREAARSALENLLGGIVSFMVGSPEAPRVARMILREQLDPSAAYDIIYSRVMARVIDSIATLLTVLMENMSPRSARIRAMAMMGQVTVFRVGRETMVRMIGLEGYTQEETDEIRRIVLEHTRGTIESLSARPAG